MTAHAVLETGRLILRPYSERDIPALLPLIGSLEVARTIASRTLTPNRMREIFW